MLRRWVVAVVVAACVSPAAKAFAVDNDPSAGLGEWSITSRAVGHGTQPASPLTHLECDLVQDYEYYDETGEFIQNIGEPYLAGCVEVNDDGTTNPNRCDPGDDACLCDHNPNLPICRGNGGCKTGGEGCPNTPPKPPKPKKTCLQCINALQASLNSAADKVKSCVNNWGLRASQAQCSRGLTRHGYDLGMDVFINRINHGSWEMCVTTPAGRTCTVLPEYRKCVSDYMHGWHEETVTSTGTGPTGVVIKVGAEPIVVEGSGTFAHSETTVTLPAGHGYDDVCAAYGNPMIDAARVEFNKCQAAAPDHDAGKTCPQVGGMH